MSWPKERPSAAEAWMVLAVLGAPVVVVDVGPVLALMVRSSGEEGREVGGDATKQLRE